MDWNGGARDHIGLHSLLHYFFFYFYSLQIQYTFCYFLDKAINSQRVLGILAYEGYPNASYEYGMVLVQKSILAPIWDRSPIASYNFGKMKVRSFFNQLVGSIFQRLASEQIRSD